MAKFEIAVYNAEVRQKMADGQRHSRLSDDWADIQYIESLASNAEQARAKFEESHPSDQGYVIEDVTEI